ncbi:hypothetical protein GOV11_01635 [Candidatus Woesearchaeota archaeon]|nr:hypothetical protein [Candidatus Woesearchaeota archaeon]
MRKSLVITIIILALLVGPFIFDIIEGLIYSPKDFNMNRCQRNQTLSVGQSCYLQVEDIDAFNYRCPWRYIFFLHPKHLLIRTGTLGFIKADYFTYDTEAFLIENITHSTMCKIKTYRTLEAKNTGTYEVKFRYLLDPSPYAENFRVINLTVI